MIPRKARWYHIIAHGSCGRWFGVHRRRDSFMSMLLGVVLALALSVMAGDVSAQTGALNKDPAMLVKKYLDLDSKGARLHALTREAQQPYVGWKDEPVWGHIVVI